MDDLKTPSEPVAATPTNGGSHVPAKTAARRQRPIGRAEIRELALLIAKELGRVLKRLDKLEAATGLSKSMQQPGTEAIAPVIKNFVETRLAPIEALVHDLDSDAMRYSGVYKSGKTYKRGQTVTHGGGQWFALETTDSKPGATGDWKLTVKAGRAPGTRDADDN